MSKFIRCPICRTPMGYRGQLTGARPAPATIDCLAGHRASTDPDEYETARIRELTREIRDYLDGPPTCTDSAHQWIEHTAASEDHDAVLECLRCHAWTLQHRP